MQNIYIVLLESNPISFSDFNKICVFSIDFRRILKYQIYLKSDHWKPSCSMRTDRRTDMTKLRMSFCNFVKVRKNLSRSRNGTTAVQLTALNTMRRLGDSHLLPVCGTELLMAHFVKIYRRSLLPKCDRISLCMSLQQNALLSVHSHQTHARWIALCKEYLHQI